MPNFLDKITNTMTQYVADAKNIKGTYVVVNDYSDLASLPVATIVEGSLAYCVNSYTDTSVTPNVTYNIGFYQYNGLSWEAANIGGGGVGTLITEVTYSQFVSAINGSQLIPGMKYRITDYVTKINGVYDLSMIGQSGAYLPYATSAEHAFDLIVDAIESDKYNENVKATLPSSGDSYFELTSSNLEAWELKWTHLNDRTKYSFADTVNGKGIIYYMKDEFNNEACYDFKNIQHLHFGLKRMDEEHQGNLGLLMDYKDFIAVGSIFPAEFDYEHSYIGYFVDYNGAKVRVTEDNYTDLGIIPGTTIPYTKQPNRYGDLLDVFTFLQNGYIGEYVPCTSFITLSGLKTFTTSDYVGYYVEYSSNKVLVTDSNKDSLDIVPGTTQPYKHSTNLTFDTTDITVAPGVNVNPISLLVFITDVSKAVLDAPMDWTYMLMGLSQQMGMTVTLDTLAYLLGVQKAVLEAMTERQVIQQFFNGYFYYTFDCLDADLTESLDNLNHEEVHYDLSLYGAYCQENKIEHTADILTYYISTAMPSITIPIVPNGLNVISFQNNDYAAYDSLARKRRIETVGCKIGSFCFLMTLSNWCSGFKTDSNVYGLKVGYYSFNNFIGMNSYSILIGAYCHDNYITDESDVFSLAMGSLQSTFSGVHYFIVLGYVRSSKVKRCLNCLIDNGFALDFYEVGNSSVIANTNNLKISYVTGVMLYSVNNIEMTSCSNSYISGFNITLKDSVGLSFTNNSNNIYMTNSSNISLSGVDNSTIIDSNQITIAGGYNNNISHCSYINTGNGFGNNILFNVSGNILLASTFGNNCMNNKLYNANYITFGNTCYGNTLEGSNSYITLGDNCAYNTIGKLSTYITIGKAYTKDNVTYGVDSKIQYCNIHSNVNYLVFNGDIPQYVYSNKTFLSGITGVGSSNPRIITVTYSDVSKNIVYAPNNYTEVILD